MRCKVKNRCGGCDFDDYKEHLIYKNKYVNELFSEYNNIEPIIGMEDPYYYRNKVLRSFSPKGRSDFSFGFYERGSHRIIETDECFIENKGAQKILKSLRDLAKYYKIEAYDEDRGRGLLRHAMVRWAHKTNEYLVIIVLGDSNFKGKKNFVKELVKRNPEITSVVFNYNRRRTSVVLEGKFERVYGPGFILDDLCGLRFKISPGSFYQVNSVQTEVLYNKALELADLKKESVLLDAYCGIGTIGLIAANKVKEVIGIESNAKAINDAELNKKYNGISNAKFIKADATEYLIRNGDKINFNKAIMDPPRTGSSKEFIEALASKEPEKIVYVSCNPETLKRDLEYFGGKYIVEEIQPVDMFPFTKHVECIALLRRVKG